MYFLSKCPTDYSFPPDICALEIDDTFVFILTWLAEREKQKKLKNTFFKQSITTMQIVSLKSELVAVFIEEALWTTSAHYVPLFLYLFFWVCWNKQVIWIYFAVVFHFPQMLKDVLYYMWFAHVLCSWDMEGCVNEGLWLLVGTLVCVLRDMSGREFGVGLSMKIRELGMKSSNASQKDLICA